MPTHANPPHAAEPESTTILLVDDDHDLLRAVAAHLSCAGHACVTADDGDRALALWRERSFDLVITDLRMPETDGCDLIQTLLETEVVPVIVITGFREDFRDRLCAFPDLVVLEKPVQPSSLLAEVARLVARARGANHNAGHAAEEPARNP